MINSCSCHSFYEQNDAGNFKICDKKCETRREKKPQEAIYLDMYKSSLLDVDTGLHVSARNCFSFLSCA